MIITTLVFLTVIWLAYKSYIIRKYPPGPFPLPIIGNLHLLRKDIHLAMDKLSKEYGTMFTLWMADKPFIVITDYDLAKKVCITKRYADRLPLYVGDVVYSRGSKDIIMGDYSDSLILHRKLAQSAFQMFGDEMESLEVRVLDNLQTFFKTCNQHIEDPKFQIFHDVEHTFFNVMSTIVLGEKIRKDCDRFLKIRQAVFYMMQSGVTLSMVNFYPVLRYLPNPELTKMIKVIQERDDVLQNLVSKIERDYDMENKPSNYIEALLRSKMENSDAENNNVENGDKKQFVDFTRDHLEMNVFDMFLAGVETVAVSATWSILFLMKWPEVQEKCHQHLDRIKGPKTDDGIQMPVRLEDKQHLPYFMAVIYETLRLASTLPFGVFHKARENTTLNGFNIKKGTPFMINLWTIHHDPKNFKDPLQFNPDRFLDQDGSLLPSSKIKNFLAFSAGPRQCIGQTIAKSELFLFLTNFLYNFKLENSPLNKELSTNGNTKVTHAPKPFNVCLKHRC